MSFRWRKGCWTTCEKKNQSLQSPLKSWLFRKCVPVGLHWLQGCLIKTYWKQAARTTLLPGILAKRTETTPRYLLLYLRQLCHDCLKILRVHMQKPSCAVANRTHSWSKSPSKKKRLGGMVTSLLSERSLSSQEKETTTRLCLVKAAFKKHKTNFYKSWQPCSIRTENKTKILSENLLSDFADTRRSFHRSFHSKAWVLTLASSCVITISIQITDTKSQMFTSVFFPLSNYSSPLIWNIIHLSCQASTKSVFKGSQSLPSDPMILPLDRLHWVENRGWLLSFKFKKWLAKMGKEAFPCSVADKFKKISDGFEEKLYPKIL